jgi:hypothetical protein
MICPTAMARPQKQKTTTTPPRITISPPPATALLPFLAPRHQSRPLTQICALAYSPSASSQACSSHPPCAHPLPVCKLNEMCLSLIGRGLALGPGVPIPEVIQRAVESHLTSGRRSISNRHSLQRGRCWWLPYIVLEFDKNQVLIDAAGGELATPLWNYRANLYVDALLLFSVLYYYLELYCWTTILASAAFALSISRIIPSTIRTDYTSCIQRCFSFIKHSRISISAHGANAGSGRHG